VLAVEDIVDTGLTAKRLLEELRRYEPASLALCALLDKPGRRTVDVPIRYTGFTIEDVFVVGYGIDYAERYRNLPNIRVLEQK
jgi:hypoxanthine phosphoribosyltransferase